MSQTAIPFLFMRGGTSRGPYMKRDDLPKDQGQLAGVLVAAVGSGHPLNIDGIGGGNAVTTKVAMLSVSDDEWADVDYFFAQVSVEDGTVDFKPSCGNILSGVGAAALEMKLLPVAGNETVVKIRAVNTGARVVSTVQTPDGTVSYAGSTSIDGVPGTAASVQLQFMDTIGGATGSLLPTGNLVDQFEGVDVTCMDVAMPMVIARAEAFGLSGHESSAELDDNRAFFKEMEAVRIAAGEAMGIENVASSVIPKFGILAPPRKGGSVAARYFMPWKTHPTMAVTGSQCIASCVLTPGSIADGMTQVKSAPATICLEHPSGTIDVLVDFSVTNGTLELRSAGLVRTTRLLARGEVYVPASVWSPS
ncbi:MAG: PrpF domain-containing protein [Pseudomonadota bacterium]